jgi:hypothetical protein
MCLRRCLRARTTPRVNIMYVVSSCAGMSFTLSELCSVSFCLCCMLCCCALNVCKQHLLFPFGALLPDFQLARCLRARTAPRVNITCVVSSCAGQIKRIQRVTSCGSVLINSTQHRMNHATLTRYKICRSAPEQGCYPRFLGRH